MRVRIDVSAGLEGVGHTHQIFVALVTPHVAPDTLDEVLAESRRAARIRQRHRIALRHHQQRIPAPVPAVSVHADGAAVDPQQRREARCRSLWLDKEELDWHPIGRRYGTAFDLSPVSWREAGQTRQWTRRRMRHGVDHKALGGIEQRRADASEATVCEHGDVGMGAAAGKRRDALDCTTRGVDRKHWCVACRRQR